MSDSDSDSDSDFDGDFDWVMSPDLSVPEEHRTRHLNVDRTVGTGLCTIIQEDTGLNPGVSHESLKIVFRIVFNTNQRKSHIVPCFFHTNQVLRKGAVQIAELLVYPGIPGHLPH